AKATPMGLFAPHERRVLAKLAAAAIPAGAVLPGGGEGTVDRLERYLAGMPPWVTTGSRPLVWAVEAAAGPVTGRPFSALSTPAAARCLDGWMHAPLAGIRHALRGILALVKLAHFDDPAVFARLGCRYGLEAVNNEAAPRWLRRVTDGRA